MKQNSKVYFSIRSRYQLKRRSSTWKARKRHKLLTKKQNLSGRYVDYSRIKYENYPAPPNFSFIDNTSSVLDYFNGMDSKISETESINIDISEINNLTPDTITLLIAKLSERKLKEIGIRGNAPKDPELKKMFVESGLYEYVKSNGIKTVSPKNKLWKYSRSSVVKGSMTQNAITLCRDLFLKNGKTYDTDPLYNLLVEAMSNTIHHADDEKNKNSRRRKTPNKRGSSPTNNVNWWLYYYYDETLNSIKFSFIDMGVGIFKSASFNGYRKVVNYFSPSNKPLVKPFLEGKIMSSRKTDTAISGKGIRQIMHCASLNEFKKFLIITNDLKIDVKSKRSEELNSNFAGTFIYFEISVL